LYYITVDWIISDLNFQ